MGKKKRKTERVLVKSAARELGVEYSKGMTLGSLVSSQAATVAQAEVARAATVSQAAAMGGVDPDDDQWRGVQTGRRDLNPMDQDKLINLANYLCRANPLGKRISEIRRDFIIGEGVTFEAEDEQVQEILDEFWEDPINNMDEFQDDIVEYLGINGELWLPTFENQFTGAVRLGWIDPIEVFKVVPDRMNRRILREAVMKYAPSTADDMGAYLYDATKKVYSIVNVNTNPGDVTFNYREGDIHFFRINGAPDARRGRSDFEPLVDFIDEWDQSIFNDLERTALALNFIWDVELEGKSDNEIKALKSNPEYQAPKPGSVRFHNEKVKWTAVAPQINTRETQELANQIRQNILGGAGLSDFFFGISDRTNRAGSDNLETPILKSLTKRQKKIKAILREVFDHAIDRKAVRNSTLKYKLESGKMSRDFDISMPEISIKDLSKIGAVLNQVAAGLVVAVQQEWVSNKTAAVLYGAFMSQFDFNIDPEAEAAQIAEEKADRAGYNQDTLDTIKTGVDALNQPKPGSPAAEQQVPADGEQPKAA
jgi:hypothetical protein